MEYIMKSYERKTIDNTLVEFNNKLYSSVNEKLIKQKNGPKWKDAILSFAVNTFLKLTRNN